MQCRSLRVLLFFSALFLLAVNTPAPLVYRPGEGWSYESADGSGSWTRTRAKDQLDVAQQAFEKKNFKLSTKAARRVVRIWPFSDYAADAQFLVGRSYEERAKDEKAFKAYQELIEKYPKATKYDEVVKRQYDIANRYLAGQWFKLWGVIPFFPSMDKTVQMYEKLLKNGPYSEVAPSAQMSIGTAREKQSDFPAAVKAYEAAADKYHDRKEVSADAVYKAGMAYLKQAKTAEYDQSIAGHAISTFTDFMTLHPRDPRVTEAQKHIATLKMEQARGSMIVARFYEKKRQWDGALVYYNEVLIRDPQSEYAEEAKQRIEQIKQRIEEKKQRPLQTAQK
ncbi:MAG TPA: outer membrane protein assembly factor BamD [Candidatus Kapabacteria bacterium]|nr:outer membrane protein assembly factor BamD [Candidatus Kapabacteria bacterium]